MIKLVNYITRLTQLVFFATRVLYFTTLGYWYGSVFGRILRSKPIKFKNVTVFRQYLISVEYFGKSSASDRFGNEIQSGTWRERHFFPYIRLSIYGNNAFAIGE